MFAEIGRFTRDIEMKTIDTKNGDKNVVNNAIAINNSKEDVTFLNITAWGMTAEFIQEYFKKGDEAFFEGELKNGKREDGSTTIYLLIKKIKFTYGKRNVDKESFTAIAE